MQTERSWRMLVPVTVAGAGLVLAMSSATARGTDLRAAPGRLSDLVAAKERAGGRLVVEERELRRQVSMTTAKVAAVEAPVAAARARAAVIAPPAGLTAVRGEAVTVALDDAPTVRPGTPASAARPDDLVVHQQDVQGVVNALWAGGAEAMTIMGKRVVSTTAVRCVGNTLLLQGVVHSPPFTITAIGPPAPMTAALDADPAVSIFRQYVAVYGLGYRVSRHADFTLPAYDGPLDLARSS